MPQIKNSYVVKRKSTSGADVLYCSLQGKIAQVTIHSKQGGGGGRLTATAIVILTVFPSSCRFIYIAHSCFSLPFVTHSVIISVFFLSFLISLTNCCSLILDFLIYLPIICGLCS